VEKLLPFLACLLMLAGHIAGAEPKHVSGDWTVGGQEMIRGKHIRLDGSLILPQGADLTLEDCKLEIVGDYSREHSVEWQGGSLVTNNSTVGGFINDSGTPIHTVFHLYDGLWEATDTIVQYSYGISFHWAQGKGVLRGTRLHAGPRPDAIILSGEADVTLVDSQFPIGLGLYVNKGGSATIDLTPEQAITATYDRTSLLPGVNWRLTMTRTHVPRWFLFVRQIGGWHPPAEIKLSGSKDLIVSLLGHNLEGEIGLSNDLAQPLRVANVTLSTTAGQPAGISMYALYFSGNDTDITITGESHICELMHRGGKLRVSGRRGGRGLSIGCTTLELSGAAQMDVRHVHLGRPLTWQDEDSIGEANVTGQAVLTGRDISVKNVRFRTEDKGSVDLRNVQAYGRIEAREDGGRVRVDESVSDAIAN
jgi:hypothetical protein